MSNPICLLMTGAGAPGAPGILHCLQQEPNLKILLADADPQAIGQYLHPSFTVIPSANSDPDGFIFSIRELVQQYQIQIILPLVTKELELLASIKEELRQQGCTVLVSNPQQLRIANDKGLLYKTLKDASILTPDFKVVLNIQEWKDAVSALGYPHKPVCFKPCIANGSRGFRVLDPTKDEWEMLFKQKPDQSLMSYEKALEILSSRAFPPLVVSEYLPGPEYSIDCLAHEGDCLIAIPRIRLKMNAGISTKGRFDRIPELEKYCADIIGLLQLHGNIGIQVKTAADGAFKILEINPRVQGTIVANMGLGINLPLLAVYQSLGRKVSLDPDKLAWGTGFSRYWQEVYYTT